MLPRAMPAAPAATGFRATRAKAGGPLTVHRVPIFVETEKRVTSKGADGKPTSSMHQFDADWIASAVASLKAREADGYFPPLHVQHHGEGKEVVAAGHFRVLGTESIQFEGKQRKAVLADLVITNPQVEADVKAMRFPYRSVEIHKLDTPSIDSLALLDAEVPHCRLPMLTVAEEAEASFRANGMAVFTAGTGAAVQFAFGNDDKPAKPKPKDDETTGDAGDKPAFGGKPSDNGPKDGDVDNDGMPDENELPDAKASTPTAKAIVEAIKSGSISVADLQAIVQAIQERSAAGGDQNGLQQGAPVPVPGQSMNADSKDIITITMADKPIVTPKPETPKPDTGDTIVKMAALQGEVEGLKANLAARDAADKRRDDVANAMKRLDGRPLGSDIESKLVKFHADYGPAAFAAHVEAIERTVGVLPKPSGGGDRFLADNAKAPAVAMKYQAKGPDAIDKAARFAAEWSQLRQSGLTNMSQDRYVQIQMAANPMDPDAAEVA